MRARGLVCVAVLGIVACLTSCSVPLPWGARLNSDGTVDFAECADGRGRVSFDYLLSDERPGGETGPVEWQIDRVHDVVTEPQIILYGTVPMGFEGAQALPPPDGWSSVEVGSALIYRSELEEGEWVWRDGRLPFIPNVPCEAVR